MNTYGGEKWTTHAAHGPSAQLQSEVDYSFEVHVKGSRVEVNIDGVRVLATNLPYTLPTGQAGLWAMGTHDIDIVDYRVTSEKPTMFVIMQYSEPYDELYKDVIGPVGEELGFAVHRADETYGPGIIIADIERRIVESRVIIADITPTNLNVYWEVGYAHALRKPTILIAERDTALPFDVSPFRTLFYDNTIGGKARVEQGLRSHIEAIQSEWLSA